MGKAEDIGKGVAMSREIIESGKALAKLSRWVAVQADSSNEGMQKYLNAAAEAGIRTELAMTL